MTLWIVMAVLTAAACLAVLMPLYRARVARGSAGAAELAIYRDQLSEVDRDLSRGLIAESEAEAARTEIARRLLHAKHSADDEATSSNRRRRQVAAVASLVLVPVVGLGLYLDVGSPGLPDQPLAARLDKPLNQQDVATLIAKVEDHLAANPEDGRGWGMLAPVYMRLGRYNDAVKAYGNALRILGPSAEREADLGEAIVLASEGMVTEDARQAFERARGLDATAVRPRFYLALALDQEGKNDEAIAAWKALLAEDHKDAPWVDFARGALAKLEGKPAPAAPPSGPSVSAAPPAATAQPGPSTADVKAAAEMTPAQRRAMINGMVERLATRLESEPDDAEGWARLLRSYMVLDRADDARAALVKARDALAGDAGKLALVNDAAKSLGLDSKSGATSQ